MKELTMPNPSSLKVDGCYVQARLEQEDLQVRIAEQQVQEVGGALGVHKAICIQPSHIMSTIAQEMRHLPCLA
jgi:hypothetical protein